jgi:ferrous iron transport protein A
LNNTIAYRYINQFVNKTKESGETVANLAKGKINTEYVIKEINTSDNEIKNFLFTLGCYQGESITIMSVLAENFIVSVNDSKYSIDKDLAEAIII